MAKYEPAAICSTDPISYLPHTLQKQMKPYIHCGNGGINMPGNTNLKPFQSSYTNVTNSLEQPWAIIMKRKRFVWKVDCGINQRQWFWLSQ